MSAASYLCGPMKSIFKSLKQAPFWIICYL